MNMRVENPDKNYRRRMFLTLLLISIITVFTIGVLAISDYKQATSLRGVWRYAYVSADVVNGQLVVPAYHGGGAVPPCTPLQIRWWLVPKDDPKEAWTQTYVQVYIGGNWIDDPPFVKAVIKP
ncbi:MAG: hypothetical protein QW304_06480 [Thermoproteota archaeon]